MGLFEWHWPADHVHINFFFLRSVLAEISAPQFPNLDLDLDLDSEIRDLDQTISRVFRGMGSVVGGGGRPRPPPT